MSGEVAPLSAAFKDLSLSLEEQDTLWYRLSCHQFSFTLGKICPNHNIRYSILVLLLVLVQTLYMLFSNIPSAITTAIISLIILTSIILDCNVIIFKQALITFQVYYKTVNIFIGILAYNIDYHYFKEYWGTNNESLAHFLSSLSIVKNVLMMFVICLTDGYNIHKYLKIVILALTLIQYLFFHYLYLYVFDLDASYNVIGKIFNHPFHYHTLAMSTISSAMIFLVFQCYSTIRYPTKLVIIPTFVKFNVLNTNTNSNPKSESSNPSDPDYSTTDNLPFGAAIAKAIEMEYNHWTERMPSSLKTNSIINRTLRHTIVDVYSDGKIMNKLCQNKSGGCLCNGKMVSFVTSTCFVWFCFIYLIGFTVTAVATNYDIIGWLFILMLSFADISTLMLILNMNWVVMRHIITVFTFWWKIQDVLLFLIAYNIIDYKSKSYNWSLEDTTLTEAYIWAILGGIGTLLAVYCVGSVHAFISTKYYAIISNITAIAAIMWFIQETMTCFLTNDEYLIVISKKFGIIISCRTITIEKGVDVTLFFILQLYSNIRHGLNSNGIEITGYVETKWKLHKKKCLDNEQTVEMNVKLLQSQP